MRDFRSLRVWQKAHRVVLSIYDMTRTFPKEELYGLTGQLRRAAVSIPANLAEGCGRSPGRDRARFFQFAMGSASELEYHLLLARDLAMLDAELYPALSAAVVEVKKMLAPLIRKVKENH